LTLCDLMSSLELVALEEGSVYVTRSDWYNGDAKPENFDNDTIIRPYYRYDGYFKNGVVPEPKQFVPNIPAPYLDAKVSSICSAKYVGATEISLEFTPFCQVPNSSDIVIVVDADDLIEKDTNNETRTFIASFNLDSLTSASKQAAWPYRIPEALVDKADSVLEYNDCLTTYIFEYISF